MKFVTKHIIPLLFLALLLLQLLFNSGCSTAPKDKSGAQLTPRSQTMEDQAQYWFNLAQQRAGSEKTEYILNGIRELIRQGRFNVIPQPLATLEQTRLTLPFKPENEQRFQLYQTILLTQLKDFETTLPRYEALSIKQFQSTDQMLLHIWHSNAYLLSSNYLEAAKQRILLGLFVGPDQLQQNNDAIWKILQIPTLQYLELFTDLTLDNRTLHGWLALARSYKINSGDPRQVMQELAVWKSRFPQHPAHTTMPTALTALSEAKLFSPKKIAVLLPQTGNLAPGAKMIRQGIESAYFQDSSANKASLQFYDSNSSDMEQAYQQAQNDGADFIIGPLKKSSISQLKQFDAFPIPVLALNIDENIQQTQENFYQFGLPVENETRQIAEKIWHSDFKKAAVLVPDNNIGERALNSFREFFERLEGEVVIQRHYKTDNSKTNSKQVDSKHSKVVKSLLAVDESENRHKRLERLIGRSVEYQQRRRQDIDAVFLYANAEDGRRLKPLLDYYFAHDIPVFSTSKIYNGQHQEQLNKDLESVQFTGLPWLLTSAEDQNQKSLLKTIIPEITTSQNGYLFAFGMDAYRLIDQIGILEIFPQQYLQGSSGNLYMNPNKQLLSQLSWGKFQKGKVVIQPMMKQ